MMNKTAMPMNVNWQKSTNTPTVAVLGSVKTSSIDLRVEPRYTLMTWKGRDPIHDAWMYLEIVKGLMAKKEFCKPNGNGVSLARTTNWNASFLELRSIFNFFSRDPDGFDIKLQNYHNFQLIVVNVLCRAKCVGYVPFYVRCKKCLH